MKNIKEQIKKMRKLSGIISENYDLDDFGDEYQETGFNQDGFWGEQGAGILPISSSTGKILVALRSSEVQEPNTWGVWGGAIDSHEKNPKNAAKREFSEETGYNGSINLIDAYVFKKNTFSYFNYIGIIDNEFQPQLNWETSKAKWVTYDELINLPSKHFGLEALIKNSNNIIKKYSL